MTKISTFKPVAPSSTRFVILAVLAMCTAVVASNILVQYPVVGFGLEDVLTYGAFTYPFAFLINDLTNRCFGARLARRVVYAGFVAAFAVSWVLATPRLALASALAFLFAQLLDIAVFSPLRRNIWWQAPLAAAIAGSLLDTILFFSLAFAPFFGVLDAFAGAPDQSITSFSSLSFVPFFGVFDVFVDAPDSFLFSVAMPTWLSLGLGDFAVKLIMAGLMLLPYGGIIAFFRPKIYTV